MALVALQTAAAIQVDLLSTDPAVPTAGDYADITFRVQSGINELVREDVVITTVDNRYISKVSSPKRLASLRPGDTATATFRVYIGEDTPEGDLNIQSLIIYDGQEIETNHELFVQQADRDVELVLGEIETTPNLLLQDTENNELRITLQNLGEKEAELVTSTLSFPSRYGSESSAFSLIDSAASIGPGEEEELVYTIDIEKGDFNRIPAQLELRYRERRDIGAGFDVREVTRSFDIPLDSSPFLEIINQEARTDMQAGSADNILRITIENSGEEEAEDVRIRLYPDISFPFIFDRTSFYIGAKIQPGETQDVDIRFEIMDDAQARDYEVFVELESLVETTRYEQDSVVTITPTPGAQGNTTQYALILIGLIVIASVAIAIWRKRKK